MQFWYNLVKFVQSKSCSKAYSVRTSNYDMKNFYLIVLNVSSNSLDDKNFELSWCTKQRTKPDFKGIISIFLWNIFSVKF